MKTRFVTSISWPGDMVEELERIEKLAGQGNLAKLIRNLLLDWLNKQEATLQNNPIGLRYESPDSKHWIDTIHELDIAKAAQDIELIQDQILLGRVFTVCDTVKRLANERQNELWKVERIRSRLNG